MPALDELEQAWLDARDDPDFRARARRAAARLRRPAVAALPGASGSARRAGHPIYLKREDLNHTGAHKINNALGQALLAQRMGKRRIIAETGAGQHGVATATACALLDLECVVYMGTEDMRRQRPNVAADGAARRDRRAGVDAGARTLKEAVSAAIRDWVTNVADTHYIIGSCVGPAPYPAIVRDLQRVIGDEARAQVLEQAGRLPERVIACVGGGSNSIGIFAALRRRRRGRADRRRGGGRGDRDRPPRRAADRRRAAPASCTARYSAIMQDEDGQILEAHSISAGLDYPGTRPRARLAARPRAGRRYVAVTDDEALAAFAQARAARGDHPGARERPRARLDARQPGQRARRRLPVGPRRQGPRRGARARLGETRVSRE